MLAQCLIVNKYLPDWRRKWQPTPVFLWTEEPGELLSIGSHRVRHDCSDLACICIGEGNGNPLQCSCLENPRDGGAWWIAVYGVAQSRMQHWLPILVCVVEGTGWIFTERTTGEQSFTPLRPPLQATHGFRNRRCWWTAAKIRRNFPNLKILPW